jgi:hypothetical protein
MTKVKMAEELVGQDDIAEEDDIITEDLIEVEELSIDENLDEEEGQAVEDLDPDETIWEGGPTAAQIVDWKDTHGEVFVSSFTPEHHIVWRTMNRLEYRMHIRNMEQMQNSGTVSQAEAALVNEEAICEICILYPEFNSASLPGELAGVPSAISQDVLEASGFVALEVRKL